MINQQVTSLPTHSALRMYHYIALWSNVRRLHPHSFHLGHPSVVHTTYVCRVAGATLYHSAMWAMTLKRLGSIQYVYVLFYG